MAIRECSASTAGAEARSVKGEAVFVALRNHDCPGNWDFCNRRDSNANPYSEIADLLCGVGDRHVRNRFPMIVSGRHARKLFIVGIAQSGLAFRASFHSLAGVATLARAPTR